MNTNGAVVIALSGGVDSSVAAALLKQQGYAMIGAHLRLWTAPRHPPVSDPDSAARQVAGALDIPLHVVDIANTFYREIVQYCPRVRRYQIIAYSRAMV